MASCGILATDASLTLVPSLGPIPVLTDVSFTDLIGDSTLVSLKDRGKYRLGCTTEDTIAHQDTQIQSLRFCAVRQHQI